MLGISAKKKSRIYSSLEKYAHSGMGMEKACESILAQPGVNSSERAIYEGVLKNLNAGQSIGSAFGEASSNISNLEAEVITAAEQGGMLEKGFSHLSTYFQRLDRARRRILKGLAYPLILVNLAIPATTLVASVFDSFSVDGPSSGPDFGGILAKIGQNMLTAYAVIAIIILLGFFLVKSARTSASTDRFLRLIPLVGKVRKSMAMERFTQVFEIFLLSGTRMSEALAGAGSASASGLIRNASQNGMSKVELGNTLASTFFDSPEAFPNDFARGVDSAEQSGQLDREFAQWGQFYSDSAQEAIDTVAEWTPKLFYWGILVFVGFLIVRAASSYFNLINRFLEGG